MAVETNWTLEVLKLTVTALTPLTVLLVGIWVRQFTEAIERKGKLSQIEVEWRLEVFKQLGPKLNQLLCSFTYVGDWLKRTPQEVIDGKRDCDGIVHTNQFLWSKEFLEAYAQFTREAFVEGGGRGLPLRLRANRDMHRQHPDWCDAWASCFVDPTERITRAQFITLYGSVMAYAVRDLGLRS